MSLGLRILSAGPGVTLQDGGRQGYLRFGVTGAGPMDALAHAVANSAVGAAQQAAAIEVSLGGVELTAEGGVTSVALAGGHFDIRLDGRELPPAVLVRIEPGAILSVRAGLSGAWCYLAVSGRIDVPPVMGSVATHTRAGIGGLCGRGLQADDVLRIVEPIEPPPSTVEIYVPHLDRPGNVVRAILGPQDDYFSPDQREAFLTRRWTVSGRSDRMGYLLEGEPLRHHKNFNIVSDGIAIGAVQVPGDGKPIVLMADRQPTGGYPKIATVIGAEVGRLAQLRPGARFTFAAVSVAEAVAARRDCHAALQRPPVTRQIVRTNLPSEFLLSLNLVGGVVNAQDYSARQHAENVA